MGWLSWDSSWLLKILTMTSKGQGKADTILVRAGVRCGGGSQGVGVRRTWDKSCALTAR